MQHTLKSLKQSGAESIAVHSFESGIYLIEATVVGNSGDKASGYLIDNQGSTLKFKSLNEAKLSLKKVNCSQIWLEAETAYDEMCGLTEKPETHMKVKITLDQH